MAGKPRALVTGGTRGIGKATVLELGKAGFDVAFTGRTRTEGQGQEIAPDGSVSVLPGSLDTTQARRWPRLAPPVCRSRWTCSIRSLSSARSRR